MKGRQRSPLEKKIQADIEAALGAEPDLLLLRNSVGEAEYFNEKTGNSWHVPYGLGVGSPDLVGILRSPSGVGCWFCLEVKRPSEDAEPAQKKCHRQWEAFGAVIYVVRSVDDARVALAGTRAALRRHRAPVHS